MNAGRWTSIVVRSPVDRAALTNALFALGAEGVQELGDDLVTHVRDASVGHIEATLRLADPGVLVELAPTPDVDWSREWKTRIPAHRVGTLVVTPPWLEGTMAGDQIVIEPGMAFGTGDHETTRGVLRLMQRVLRAGDDVADLGAGSAVLAIAAAKLGARRCIAIELDPDAIGNAEANVATNGVGAQVTIIPGDARTLLPLVAPVRLVLANIVSSVLIELLPAIRAALTVDGQAILSGVMVEEQPAMRAALKADGWRVDASDEEGQWWTVAVARA